VPDIEENLLLLQYRGGAEQIDLRMVCDWRGREGGVSADHVAKLSVDGRPFDRGGCAILVVHGCVGRQDMALFHDRDHSSGVLFTAELGRRPGRSRYS
jgi:hypothetical protein